jgi:hypothetical protein
MEVFVAYRFGDDAPSVPEVFGECCQSDSSCGSNDLEIDELLFHRFRLTGTLTGCRLDARSFLSCSSDTA